MRSPIIVVGMLASVGAVAAAQAPGVHRTPWTHHSSQQTRSETCSCSLDAP